MKAFKQLKERRKAKIEMNLLKKEANGFINSYMVLTGCDEEQAIKIFVKKSYEDYKREAKIKALFKKVGL